jgi:spore germination cell wall hydrolase CwlJ-like protein
MTPAELDTMARTIAGEARGEPLSGQIAVAWVILNRARDPGPDWWGDSITAVCHKPQQFSCWNPRDPNAPRIAALTLDDNVFLKAMAAALLAITREAEDPTGGATHYCTIAPPSAHVVWPPRWAATMRHTIDIGSHRFYKET